MKRWYRDPAFWVVLVSFGLFLTTLIALLVSLKKPRQYPKPAASARRQMLINENNARSENDTEFNHKIIIDARNYKKWVYYNFTHGIVHPHYVSSLNWDLAFKRYHIIANGGSINLAGQGGILDLGNVNPEKIAQAPLTGYVLDSKTQNGLDSENVAIRHWYNYDYASHVLTPNTHLYVVRTPDNRYYLFRILDYYCRNLQSGCLTLEYRPLKN